MKLQLFSADYAATAVVAYLGRETVAIRLNDDICLLGSLADHQRLLARLQQGLQRVDGRLHGHEQVEALRAHVDATMAGRELRLSNVPIATKETHQ